MVRKGYENDTHFLMVQIDDSKSDQSWVTKMAILNDPEIQYDVKKWISESCQIRLTKKAISVDNYGPKGVWKWHSIFDAPDWWFKIGSNLSHRNGNFKLCGDSKWVHKSDVRDVSNVAHEKGHFGRQLWSERGVKMTLNFGCSRLMIQNRFEFESRKWQF